MSRDNKEPAFLSQEPPIQLNETAMKGCLTFVDGVFTYFINRPTKKDLLWSFWHCWTTYRYGDDPDLHNDFYPALTSKENWVEYSETIVIPDDDVRREAKYPMGYKISSHRIDFYVTKSEFKDALVKLRPLGGKRGDTRITEVTIFHGVRVRLLDDSEFGESALP